MTYGSKLLWVGIGLCAGNFIYEAFGAMNWARAIEHAWFDASTLLIAWLVLRFIPGQPVSQGEEVKS